MSLSTVLAKALFDNTAESPEELAFRKGDILMVLEREQGGGPGWWLCSLHGRQGIAPANRLRLLQTPTQPGSDPAAPRTPSVAAEDADGVYRSPPPPAATRAGELCRGEAGGRPRSHSSSSGARPRPDWDVGAVGAASRPRSPSLRGRGAETAGLYQTPTAPPGSSARPPGASLGPEAVYLSPRPAGDPEDNTYLVPRETVATGHSDGCYLLPRGTPLAGDDVYQTPTGAVAATPANGTPQAGQEAPPGVYQTPRTPHPQPPPPARAQSPGPRLKGTPIPSHRGSPMLVRAGQVRVPGSPNFARKPPPPAPPVRSVTRKDLPAASPQPPPVGASPRPGEGDRQRGAPQATEERVNGGLDAKSSVQTPKGDSQDYEDPMNEQVYDTPPSGRWQRPAHPVLSEDESIYNTPRAAPKADCESEVYDVPTITLNASTTDLQHDDVADDDDDVYSVPTLPGLPSGPGEPVGGPDAEEPDPRDRSGDAAERDGGGIYDMPALGGDGGPLPHSSSSSSASTRRLSVSSGGSGDAQWREDGAAPGGRPRLPSQDSLSRRPLPALPAPDGGKPSAGGMGSRKGSWIQERPLPPTPQPAFPLPPPQLPVTLAAGPGEGDDDPSNEYAGIGLTPSPVPVPAGDSVGYVKLQGKPEPSPEAPTENGHMITAEPRMSPSPPLPLSLSLEDSELLSFYSSQSLAHLSCLADSIDVLFSSVQGNQPPRVFVARGKSLIVTAHKLVFIGDTLSRLLTSPDLRAKVTTSGARLCQALKAVVMATKGAAQNYPSVSATQEMVDRVAELSQQAAGFSGLLQRLAEIS